MKQPFLMMLASLAVMGVLVFMLATGDRSVGPATAGEPLLLYCAASNRAVMEEILAEYREEFGRTLHVQYGASQSLLASIQASRSGDLYLPADNSYIEIARDQGLIAEVIPLAQMHAVVAVRKGNPLEIDSFEDLLRDDVRLVQANPAATAIGKLTRQALRPSGKWQDLDKATMVYQTTVTDVANDLVVGAADAGIVYDAALHTYRDLEFIEIREFASAISEVAVGVISTTEASRDALHFARYCAAKDRGQQRYGEHGFRASSSELWSDRPQLTLFAGAMLRPAIENTITRFEQREGITVSRVYNGCGILVAQMKGGQYPDAYFACDQEFMDQVADLFANPIDVSQNELVILVQKGNPHGIRSLGDLGREGLRVGIGHEKQCAMGWLTQNTLREGGVQQEVMKNVTVQTPTGDMLVNQLLAGSLDAAVAYLSNAAGAGDTLDAIQIQGIPCAVATQPWAIASNSKYPQTASRLFALLSSPQSQEVFRAEGFRWKLSERP